MFTNALKCIVFSFDCYLLLARKKRIHFNLETKTQSIQESV